MERPWLAQAGVTYTAEEMEEVNRFWATRMPTNTNPYDAVCRMARTGLGRGPGAGSPTGSPNPA